MAKVLNLPDRGNSILRKIMQRGKGKDLHEYLQMMLKEQAELYGWKARIEGRIPWSLESVSPPGIIFENGIVSEREQHVRSLLL
jgi:hypothetical protein